MHASRICFMSPLGWMEDGRKLRRFFRIRRNTRERGIGPSRHRARRSEEWGKEGFQGFYAEWCRNIHTRILNWPWKKKPSRLMPHLKIHHPRNASLETRQPKSSLREKHHWGRTIFVTRHIYKTSFWTDNETNPFSSTVRVIFSDSWIGLTLIFVVPPAACFCLGWRHFGITDWAGGHIGQTW